MSLGPMKYAIFQTAGKQYQVKIGDELDLEKISAPKKKIIFDQLLLLRDDKKTILGTPFIKNASIEAEIIDQIKAPKIRTAVYKAKSRYRRVKGHRQHLTRVKITRILTRENQKAVKKSK